MIQVFPYYIIVLLIIYITSNNIMNNIKRSPKKIKLSMAIMLVLTLARYITIFLCGLISKQDYLNIIKPASFLYFLYIPIIVIICFYIFWRNDKVNFTKVNILSLFLFSIYIIVVVTFNPYFRASWHYGYVITSDNDLFFKTIYIAILTIILSFLILSNKTKYCNEKGVIFIIFTVVAIIIENSLYLLDIYYFPNCILSEFILVLVTYYGVNTFKVK